MKKIDLHVHTTASDGTLSPTEVIALAGETGLAAVAITDHDTVIGIEEAKKAGETYGVEVVPGIELSTKFKASVHMLGYYIDIKSESILETLDGIVRDRELRNEKLVKLMQSDGVKISVEGLHERFGEVVGRPHFAEILVEQGFATDMKDAFSRLLNKDKPYYIPRHTITLKESVDIIRNAGGVAVLAHPFNYKYDEATLNELVSLCVEYGIVGLECLYSGQTEEEDRYYCSLAEKYGLIKTGGSDFHGSVKKDISLGSGKGRLCVPYEYLEELKKAAGK